MRFATIWRRPLILRLWMSLVTRYPVEIRISCAGWSVRKEFAAEFGEGPSHLARYATRFNAVEINSSFYRPHRPATYARWAASVPDDFRFAVKVPKEITHVRRLVDSEPVLDRFLAEAVCLGDKLGPMLVHLPPSLDFEACAAEAFFTALRRRFTGAVVCEPRHATWFELDATEHLTRHRVARVAADPAVVPAASEPGGWTELAYYRLHGSPDVYYSSYSDGYLAKLASMILRASATATVWCIFDNTARGAATLNAFDLMKRLQTEQMGSSAAGGPQTRLWSVQTNGLIS